MSIGWFLVAAIVLVAFGGLMAAVDSAILALSRVDIAELAETHRAKRSLRAISADTGAHLNAISFMRIIAETTSAVLVTLVFATTIEQLWLALVLSAALMTAVSFVLVGASPRSVGRAHPDGLLAGTAPLVHFLRVLLGPIANALVALGNRVTPGRTRLATFTSEDQLLSMVDEATELDVLEEDDRELIHSIFEFNDTVVREVMIPRTDMVTMEVDASLGEAMGLFLSKGFSRVPVIDGEVDDVTGIVYLRDVARLVYERPPNIESLTVGDLARPAVFVPESKKADELLRQMQLESNHLAMVVDEYGGIAGLVTLEDLIEELVGDISDEYDRDVVEVEDLGHGRFRVSARLPVDELGELFDLELDDDEVDSVGGLLAKALGRLPVAGSVARTSGLVLTAERTEGRRKRISTVLVQRDEALIEAQTAFLGVTDDEGVNGHDHRK
ncbi:MULTISPECIES: hemolysin family protein [Cryobacterium]|uniref:HlyC/CorC family transporter n=1 Tax=Cryobacterium glucosi TaxID=1259175 RepID=A0ABY2IRV5_9MICO|nr:MULTISPECIES: hemolysin family protein [Cryobacterium]TFB92117.1 HlyC/CorC family transporter [Cryobacterium sp. MDB2-A-1]TFC11723.1 HlyC/CorC family transporter [Cryobacterium sp. MDB2-33-2]TFC15473.1 HlyC/CorC family transporter [Cryobacterium sp. MDB2-A-2]TFC20169.1 HlyC/CorC family transporter [Cryobacterium sp. MDB2-10]TFC21355.1 HlyC/CorC family transporter [Cryobacterium glucosi]